MTDPTTTMLLIAGLASAIALIVAWEVSGRWAYLSSKTARRLQDAEAIEFIDALSNLPEKSLERRLLESGAKLTITQFRLLVIGLGASVTLAAWAFFIPGLPALALGAIAGYLPIASLSERAKSRGLEMDKLLPIALSRIAAGLQQNRGLDEVLEMVGNSLLTGGANPLTPELLKTAQDMRTKNQPAAALRDLAKRSPSVSLSNVAILLESYLRAGGGQYAEVVSQAARGIQGVIAIRNRARAKAGQAIQAAKMVPAILGVVLLVMMNDPVTAESFRLFVTQILIMIGMGVMAVGYGIIRNEIMKVV